MISLNKMLLWPVLFLTQMQESLSGRPVFIDVLVHQEITVRIFCEFPGSGSWVVRVVAPWGKWNTNNLKFFDQKNDYIVISCIIHIYIYTYVYVYHCVVSSCCFVVACCGNGGSGKSNSNCFWRNPRCSIVRCSSSQATITWHRSPKRRRCHEQPRNLMGRKRTKPCTPNYFTERLKGDVKAAKLTVQCTLVASQTPVTSISSLGCMFAYIARGILRKPALLSHFESMYCMLFSLASYTPEIYSHILPIPSNSLYLSYIIIYPWILLIICNGLSSTFLMVMI